MPRLISSIKTALDVEKVVKACSKILETADLVGDTYEIPISGEFVVDTKELPIILGALYGMLPGEVLKREEAEYTEIVNTAVVCCTEEFSRDIHSRRAIAINTGCLTYLHFYIRNQTLYQIVHMRGQDIRKMLSDFWLILVIVSRVLEIIPKGVEVQAIKLLWAVDCFHKYKDPSKVPL